MRTAATCTVPSHWGMRTAATCTVPSHWGMRTAATCTVPSHFCTLPELQRKFNHIDSLLYIFHYQPITIVGRLLPRKLWCRNKITRRSLLSKCHTVSRCMCNCDFIYAHRKSTAFPTPVFTKLTMAQHQCVDIFHNESYSFFSMYICALSQ
jgi:hypothetical protein